MIAFQFQKENKNTGCEDAPPVATVEYSIVCDGLGGAGSTKFPVVEEGKTVNRTSAYLGARAVADCVDRNFKDSAGQLGLSIFNDSEKLSIIKSFVYYLKEDIKSTLNRRMAELGIEPLHSRTLKVFPTTLASALYYQRGNVLRMVAVWAGDSRVYVLSPSKGLRLLSVDDAENSSETMNSSSTMNNCISAGNDFHLNYTFYEMKEPGVVFCCSDGCFDYIPSPLNLEWLLLKTILDMPACDKKHLGKKLADSIRDSIYQSIGDDTTMSGICFGISSGEEMKKLYKKRMSEFEPYAVKMNDCLRKLKKNQNDRDSAQKVWRLNETKVSDVIQSTVFACLNTHSPAELYHFLTGLPCCPASFRTQEAEISNKAREQCSREVDKLREKAEMLKKECINLLVLDYLRCDYGNESKHPQKILANPGKTIEIATEVLKTCIEMYNRADLRKYDAERSALSEEAYRDFARLQIPVLKDTLKLLQNRKGYFTDLWSQAYFSTEMFKSECYRLESDKLFEEELQEPEKHKKTISSLTMQKIHEYRIECKRTENEIGRIKERYDGEKKKQLEDFHQKFYSQNKDEILEELLKLPEKTVRAWFGHSYHLIDLSKAKKKLDEAEKLIPDAQEKVEQIWNWYRQNYELFKQLGQKGEI